MIDIELWRWFLKIWLNAKKWKLKDLYWITRDVSNIWKFGNWDYEVKLSSQEKIPEVKDLIRQHYNTF